MASLTPSEITRFRDRLRARDLELRRAIHRSLVDTDVVAHCRAHFGAQVEVGDVLPPIAHGFTHFRLTLHPQRVRARTWPSRAEAPGRIWLTRDDAVAAALPAPIRKLLRTL